MAAEKSLVVLASAIEEQKLLLKAKDEEIAALKSQLKAASVAGVHVDTKTDVQPGETKLSRVDTAKQQICKASFTCFGGKYQYRYKQPCREPEKKQIQLYCCVYTRLDLDTFYMIFFTQSCRIALERYSNDGIYNMYKYESDRFTFLYSPIKPLSDDDLEIIKRDWPLIKTAGSLIRVYCSEKRYKMLIEQGLFDGDIPVIPLNNDEE